MQGNKLWSAPRAPLASPTALRSKKAACFTYYSCKGVRAQLKCIMPHRPKRGSALLAVIIAHSSSKPAWNLLSYPLQTFANTRISKARAASRGAQRPSRSLSSPASGQRRARPSKDSRHPDRLAA